MAKNFIQPGNTIALTAPYAVVSGDGLLVGSIFGVATGDAANGVELEAMVTGVFDLAKAGDAVTQGAKLYWDNTNKNLTTTLTANTLIGAAVSAAAIGDATVIVRLNGSV